MIILASGSPRRKELLGLITPDFTVKPADTPEKIDPALSPPEAVVSLAMEKAQYNARIFDRDCIIAADTVVCLDGRILGKPYSKDDACFMLRMLSGRVHQVYTGVAVLKPGFAPVSFFEKTQVEFYTLEEALIESYVNTGEPMDKAGAYGIQGKGAVLVRRIEGDYSNVVGLPVARLYRELQLIGEL